MTIDWNDPAARDRLFECVGPEEYDRLHGEQMARSTVATVNGHAIHKVQSRFGKLYQVGRTGTLDWTEHRGNLLVAMPTTGVAIIP